MTATEFRTKCYRLMDEVAETGRELVITKRGGQWRGLCHFGPLSVLLGRDRDVIEICSVLDAPVDVEWDAAKNTGTVLGG